MATSMSEGCRRGQDDLADFRRLARLATVLFAVIGPPSPLGAQTWDVTPNLTGQADAYRQMTAEVLTRNARGQWAYLAEGTRAGWVSEVRVGQDGSQVVFVRVRPVFGGGIIRVPLAAIRRAEARIILGRDRAWLRAEPRVASGPR